MAGKESDQQDHVVALTAQVAEAARRLFAADSPTDTLAQVLALSVASIDACDFAGVVLIEAQAGARSLETGRLASELDLWQRRLGEGPALDAMDNGLIAYAEDLGVDPRWPRFTSHAAARGVRSVLALPLISDHTVGALTLYARHPEAFGALDRARGLLLAALAALAFSSAQTQEADERREANLRAALATREIIGQAQGILMERERISADQAFDMLRRASQHLNQKLRDVAQDLVDTGEHPSADRHRPDQ